VAEVALLTVNEPAPQLPVSDAPVEVSSEEAPVTTAVVELDAAPAPLG
jgi:hypothetical protein